MRPSNHFSDITESQFLKKEAEKNQYKNELQHQMENRKKRIEEEK